VCAARPDVVAERARRRLEDPDRVSDADADVAARLAASFEPLDADPELDLVVEVRTDAPGDGALEALAAALDH
jgi:predicted kinase